MEGQDDEVSKQDKTQASIASTDEQDSAEKKTSMLSLPAPTSDDGPDTNSSNDGGFKLGEAMKMESLGPMVINSNGTLSRISNWSSMSNIERERTVRVLSKRNMIRRERLESEVVEGDEDKIQ